MIDHCTHFCLCVVIVAFGLTTCLTVVPAVVAQQPVDESLAAAYEQLKADPSLQDEQTRHRMLMQMADQYSQYAEAAFQATEDLQSYAAKVRATGLLFRAPLAKVRRFDKGLKKLTEHPAFKSFQKYAAVKGHASTVVGLGDRLSTTMNNPNLPPGARNSLAALQALGTGLEQLGDVPLAGPMLEGYGKILSGLTDAMNGLAGKATITAKEGIFSTTEEQSVLKGLDRKHQYAKTPLWHRGIPMVQEYPFAVGQERYYLQMPGGTWIGIADYDELAEVAVDYYLAKKKNPDAETLWQYYNDPDERDKLGFWAEVELENRRIEEVLGDLPGVDRSTRYAQFVQTEDRIKHWHKDLGLPLEYDALNRLIRIEVANPGGVARAVRARVLRAYPGFAAYVATMEENPLSLDMDALIALFGIYRRGEHLQPWLCRGVWLPEKYLPPGYRQYADDPVPTGDPPHGYNSSQSLWYGVPLRKSGSKPSASSGEHPYTVYIDGMTVYTSVAMAEKHIQLGRPGLAMNTPVALGDEAYVGDRCKGDDGSIFKEYANQDGVWRRDINVWGIRIGKVTFGLRVAGYKVMDYDRNASENRHFVAYATPSRKQVMEVAELFVASVRKYADDKGWLSDKP